MNDYKTLLELVEKYNKEAIRVFKKLQRADQKAKTGILQYGCYSVFERTEWYCANENYITVRYCDDDFEYGSSTLLIPTDILFDDIKIDEWVKSKIDNALEKKNWNKRPQKNVKRKKSGRSMNA